MGCSYSDIAKIRGHNGQISSLITNLKTTSEELKEILQKDGNYQLFKLGTDKGYSLDEDLVLDVNTVIDQFVPALNDTSSAISSFCDKQEELNRAEELRKQREEKASQQTTNSESSETVIPDKVVKPGDSVKGDKLWHYQEKE